MNLGIIEFVARMCFLFSESTLNGQTWNLRVIRITMQNVDLQQRLVHVLDWGHNHKGPKLINLHIQHKYDERILN